MHVHIYIYIHYTYIYIYIIHIYIYMFCMHVYIYICVYKNIYINILLKQVKSNKHVGKTTLMVLSIERVILVCPRFSIKFKW